MADPPRKSRNSAPPPRGDHLAQTTKIDNLAQTSMRLGHTVRMDGLPRPMGKPSPVTVPSAEPMAAPPQRVAGKGVELLVVDETHFPGAERKPWRAAEVWTKRRVYALDSTFRCFEIIDRETGRPETGNEILGARLGGGRLREKDSARFSYPLPLPGMEAMFSKGKKHGYTSAIERMILRIRVLHTGADDAPPSWEAMAGRWSDPPPGR